MYTHSHTHTRLELKEAQVSAKDTTPLHDNIITEDETSVGSGVVVSLESELDMERETETEDSLGMRLALGSQVDFYLAMHTVLNSTNTKKKTTATTILHN